MFKGKAKYKSAVLLGAVGYSSASIFAKLAAAPSPSIVIVLYRTILTLLVLMPAALRNCSDLRDPAPYLPLFTRSSAKKCAKAFLYIMRARRSELALKYVSAPFVSTFKILKPFIASVFAFILFGEIPGIAVVVGGLTSITGVLIYTTKE